MGSDILCLKYMKLINYCSLVNIFKWLREIQVNTYFLCSYVLMGFVLD